jgi:hypothetical protein
MIAKTKTIDDILPKAEKVLDRQHFEVLQEAATLAREGNYTAAYGRARILYGTVSANWQIPEEQSRIVSEAKDILEQYLD